MSQKEWKIIRIDDGHDEEINFLCSNGWDLNNVVGDLHYFCRDKKQTFTGKVDG